MQTLSGIGLPRAFRKVPRTGVIYVMTEAEKHGFSMQRDRWSNLGQGAPETGELPGAPDRLHGVSFTNDEHEYAPVAGLNGLRDAVAELYNRRYRQGKASQYTRENVSICAGGRLALTRLFSTVGATNVGHFLPDYTAYEELLSTFGTFVPIPILTEPHELRTFNREKLEREILGRGLSALLVSNPCNPTGRLIQGEELASWVQCAREFDCTLIMDEFYSHYIYGASEGPVSAAAFVEDVNEDPVVLVDGLTKNWRYPGLRISWTAIIDAVTSAGSYLDGGAPRPMQLAALELMQPDRAAAEARAIRTVFTAKRSAMLEGLRQLGIRVDPEPDGGFYCWGDVSGLPEHCNTGTSFFQAALAQKVVCVPGGFFDINPGKRRPDRACRWGDFVRFSFGPPLEEIELGLRGIHAAIHSV
ncbi:MAG: pyridoxal phosphate-dependent aminotransferase [Planctomycetota bacterium]|nr:pyridoxal phosphate-dependent aminotransferase [Planctomycetota bacterium]